MRFETPVSGNVKLSIYDISGKELAILLNGRMNSGAYEYQWNAVDYPSGVYFYRLVVT
ncbi:MAG: T9SS type A sorting domain-containing protein [Ignavibacteria bacterium]|nr:T9SS type A sorting domain-containing protein [Ignavibacteria bacterium]